MTKHQEVSTPVAILVIIVVFSVAGYLYFALNGVGISTTVPPTNIASTQDQIQNDNDLNTVSNDLDNTDTSQIDTQLTQLRTDSSSF